MTDFGADAAFGRVPAKLQEHYGIAMPVSAIQRTTEHHAEGIYRQEVARVIDPGTAAGVIFIGELDGSMVPVVEPSPDAADQRKDKLLSWKEVRLNLAHPKGSVSPIFGGNFAGGRGKRAAMGALRGEGRVRSGESTPCRGRWGTLDCESDGSAIRDPRALFGRFLPCL
jgi:hypothetical protein